MSANQFGLHFDGEKFDRVFLEAETRGGPQGHIATVSDVIDARLHTNLGHDFWERFCTTLSAEYVGLSRAGNPIVIVAHGVGPLATYAGILETYSHDRTCTHGRTYGGRISAADFHRLENGFYGKVTVLDLQAVWRRSDLAFSGTPLTHAEIMAEPLWQTRLGPHAEPYLLHHKNLVREWRRQRLQPTMYEERLVGMQDAMGCYYASRELLDRALRVVPNTAVAHLLTVSGLAEHQLGRGPGAFHREALACVVHAWPWNNGTRLMSVKPTGKLRDWIRWLGK